MATMANHQMSRTEMIGPMRYLELVNCFDMIMRKKRGGIENEKEECSSQTRMTGPNSEYDVGDSDADAKEKKLLERFVRFAWHCLVNTLQFLRKTVFIRKLVFGQCLKKLCAKNEKEKTNRKRQKGNKKKRISNAIKLIDQVLLVTHTHTNTNTKRDNQLEWLAVRTCTDKNGCSGQWALALLSTVFFCKVRQSGAVVREPFQVVSQLEGHQLKCLFTPHTQWIEVWQSGQQQTVLLLTWSLYLWAYLYNSCSATLVLNSCACC